MRTLSILGATGSIGRSTLQVVRANPGQFQIIALVGGHDASALAQAAIAVQARFAALADPAGLGALKEALGSRGIACGAGERAVLEAAAMPTDLIVAGISGIAGLKPTVAALAPGRRLALANKETLVCAGDFFMAEARRLGSTILPMDSEHNAVAQALCGRSLADVARITLTASGGPFRTWDVERIRKARPEEALIHPNYAMGAKITVDSAGLVNKGLELIEAHHIFGIEPDRLAAVIHPQQIMHGLVSFTDGSMIAGMAHPNMCVPIADCLAAERRLASGVPAPDLASLGGLSFEAPDLDRFPALGLAMQAMRAGGHATAILNAADEVAVEAFLAGAICFGDIHRVIEETLEITARDILLSPSSVEEALAIDHIARIAARGVIASGRVGSA
ncbi:MAG: 1-deoxy-D-xylulose-5-phosphate reductoisomerase [Hyphomicrobiales bacterium]|jgi:1-deoxy-D-xylulose-5-phosphate reductoisomerase|nr:1-deoxy-D-xylulose-5-phosphate reductoisomerase [Hyphomicrobiales bacterium]